MCATPILKTLKMHFVYEHLVENWLSLVNQVIHPALVYGPQPPMISVPHTVFNN